MLFCEFGDIVTVCSSSGLDSAYLHSVEIYINIYKYLLYLCMFLGVTFNIYIYFQQNKSMCFYVKQNAQTHW